MANGPTPPNPANAPKAAGGFLKKVPTWAWLAGGGAALGIGYALYRDRQNPDAAAAPAGEASLGGLAEYDLSTQPSPAGTVNPSYVVPSESAETVGAIGQTALETVGGMFASVWEGIPTLVETLYTPPGEIIGQIFTGIAGLPQSQPPPAPVVTIQNTTPSSPTSGPPASCPGCNVAGRRFTNCKAAHEIATPEMAARDWNVFTCHGKNERWRKGKDGGWRKIADF